MAGKVLKKQDASVSLEDYDSFDVLVASTADSQERWVLDSGCSFYMCPHHEWFQEFNEYQGGSILLGNNKACKVSGIGKVQIRMYDGCTRTLGEVRYVPDLKRNLLSIGVLDKLRYSIKVIHGEMKVSKAALTVMRGTIENGLYMLAGNTIHGKVYAAVKQSPDNTPLWHKRLAHVREQGLQELSRQGLLCGDNISKQEFSEA